MDEEFETIKVYENLSVSKSGNVIYNGVGIEPKIEDGFFVVRLREHEKPIKVHRLVADAFIPNPKKKLIINHIDNNRLNNNVNNLRWATIQEMSFHQVISKNNTSGSKGIYYKKSNDKWRAMIFYNGKLQQIGNYDKKEDAIEARKQKAKELFGEFLNQCEK